MGRAPEIGEDEEDVPAAADGGNGLVGYGLSRVEIDEDDDEFRLSLLRRLTASPDAGIGWAAADVVDGFMEGKGRGGGMRAVVPVLELVPREGGPMLATRVGRIKRSATVGLSTAEPTPPPVEAVLIIPAVLGGERDNTERIPLLFGREELESESRCLFLSRVGTKPSRSSEMKRDERRDSSSSSWKSGVTRYVVDNVKDPRR